MSTRIFGSGIKRREDPRLITGEARYTDDIKLQGVAAHGGRAQPLCPCPHRLGYRFFGRGRGNARRCAPSSPAMTIGDLASIAHRLAHPRQRLEDTPEHPALGESACRALCRRWRGDRAGGQIVTRRRMPPMPSASIMKSCPLWSIRTKRLKLKARPSCTTM